ncbi:MAG: hypothetical protein WBW88_13895 [Rhodothermales bacterium]
MRRVLPLILLALTSCAQRDGTKAPEIRWYRGNLHTHTLWSDGDDFPDMVVDWYREAGYDFLALSDHNVLSEGERWVDVDQKLRPAFDKYVDHLGPNAVDTVAVAGTTRVRLKTLAELRAAFEEPDRFILIQSEEITESVDKLPVHLNATNVKEFIPPQGGSTVVEVMQRNIDAVLAQRERTHQAMFPHINHPNFGWGITVEDILAVEGEKFFEIYNGHPLVHNLGDADHSSVEDMWDVILATRLSTGGEPMYGLAVDDAHHYHGMDRSLANPGRGWVMVGADTLTPEGIVDAMEAGRFYASTGVVLRDVRRLPDRLEIDIQPEVGVSYKTEFVGSSVDTTSGTRSVGVVLSSAEGTQASYALRADELYVRARVISSKPKANPNHDDEVEMAWTQPVVHSAILK